MTPSSGHLKPKGANSSTILHETKASDNSLFLVTTPSPSQSQSLTFSPPSQVSSFHLQDWLTLPPLIISILLPGITTTPSSRLGLDLPIPNHLHPVIIHHPFRHNLMPPHRRPKLRPQRPINHTNQQHRDTHHREHIVRIPIRVPIPRRRDERHNDQKHIARQKQQRDRQVRMPPRRPVL